MSPCFQDITGFRFGKMLVLGRNGFLGRNQKAIGWKCQCDCGTIKTVAARDLKSAKIKSCGCLRNKMTGDRRRIHGGKGTPEYRIWKAMKERCSNPNHIGYARYGGRGIRVCDRWRSSFSVFLADMGPRPGPEYSIDRYPDSDGNYEPGNCRWATSGEQRRNRPDVRLVTHCGKTQSVRDWANQLGIKYPTLMSRLNRGASIEEAMRTGLSTEHSES